MWYHLTDKMYDVFLLSFNLFKTNDIKKVKRTLYYLSNNLDANYISFDIPKKNGKLRTIYEPSGLLKNVQRNILKNILEDKKISKYAKAYQRHISLVDNAIEHINKKIILKLDIKDFFPSINFNMVYNTCFNETLYPRKLGILLTNICMYNNELPQGTPTAAYISNIILRSFDEKIGNYCDNLNISYTRYSDDLTFSGDFNVQEIISLVKDELRKYHFKLNYDKIKVIRNNNRQIVTGIVVNKKLSIKREYKKKIRQEIYYINKYGIDSHLKKLNIDNKNKYLHSLKGKVNFVLQVEDNNKEFKKYQIYIDNLLFKIPISN